MQGEAIQITIFNTNDTRVVPDMSSAMDVTSSQSCKTNVVHTPLRPQDEKKFNMHV